VQDTENFIELSRSCKALQIVVFPVPDGADTIIKFFIEYFELALVFFLLHPSLLSHY